MQRKFKVIDLLFMILCVGSMFIYSYQLTDPYILTKWLYFLVVVSIGVKYCTIKKFFHRPFDINVSKWGIIIVFTCFLQAIYGIFQYIGLFFPSSIFKVTGSFDNPAGFSACICSGFPFIKMLLLKDKERYNKYIAWSVGTLIIVAVILSESRAGIISIVMICCLWAYKRFKLKYMYKVFLFLVFICILIGIYFIKKDSADGRLLIWKCGINMVTDAFWIGQGPGCFEAQYMDYQADYFRKYPQSYYSMLAGNVKQPFNEYLGLLLNYGLIGLIILLAIVTFLFYCYRKKKDTEKRIAVYSLFSIGIFAFFSYPFTYPFIWIVLFFCIYVLIKERINYVIPVWVKRLNYFCVLICCLLFFYKLIVHIQQEKEWKQAFSLSQCGQIENALLYYKKLEGGFSNNPYFLYNYTAVLFENKLYNESLRVALLCRRYWADYDLEVMTGIIYQHLGELNLAEKYYYNSIKMCPSRFRPLYQLFQLYKENGDIEQACQIASQIINKPMKIETSEILMMKREVEYFLLKFSL